MSIYSSVLHINNQEENDEDDEGNTYPYHGSHILPEHSATPGGWLDVAQIPNHIKATRENPDDCGIETDEQKLKNYKTTFIRVTIGQEDGTTATLLLDEKAVKALQQTLTDWIDTEILY